MYRRLTGLPQHFNGPTPFLPEGTDGSDGAGGGGGAGSGKAPDADTYKAPASQADLDRIIADRLARERSKFSDYDDLKRKASEHDKAVEAARSEHEKAVEAARKEGETSALATANTRLVAAEARVLAATGETKWRISPAAVVRQLDLSGVKVSDKGDVNADAIKTALEDLAKAEPGLVDDGKGKPPKPDPTQGPRAAAGKAADGLAEARKRFGPKAGAAQQ